jgi:predicted CoA-binding protein
VLNKYSIAKILSKSKTIAVVGLSMEPRKDSYKVAEYLQSQGYKIIPINPSANQILSEKSYDSIVELPENLKKTVDVIDIFRPSNEVSEIITQAIKMKKRYDKPDVIWMQLNIFDINGSKEARNAGIDVIMDKCMMIEHKRLFHKDY